MLLLVTTLAILVACKTSNPTKDISILNCLYTAQSDDTVLSYQFELVKDSRFFYIISYRDSNQKIVKGYYSGHGVISGDTIYLTYKKNKRPSYLKNFLLKEVSGNYLIQNFADDTKRIFMRIYRLNMR